MLRCEAPNTPVVGFCLREAERLLRAGGLETADVLLRVDPTQNKAVAVESEGLHAVLSGRNESDLRCALYLFFESLGCLFRFSGETLRFDRLQNGAFPTQRQEIEPPLRYRGIRMHLNFVQDQSCFTEDEFAAFVDNVAKMKLNYLLFHMYNPQEWYPFTYRGLEHLDLSVGNLERKPLDPAMIGRERIRVKEHWFPADLEAVRDTRQLRDAMQARYARMMTRAKERGIRVAASIEPEALPEAFEQALPAWSDTLVNNASSLVNDWQQGWSGKKVTEADVRSPLLVDIAVSRCLALLDAYPMLDELQLISREGTAWKRDDPAEYEAEYRRLTETYDLAPDAIDWPACHRVVPEAAGEYPVSPRVNPYWTVLPGDDYRATVLGAIRYAEFVRAILADERIRRAAWERGVRFTAAIYSPNPETVRLMSPGVAAVLPQGMPISYLADYGARDICEGMDGWQPLLERGLPTGLISWLEFDGCMMLAQGWQRSIYDNVRKAADMGCELACFNHWRVRSLEQNAQMAADSCFFEGASYEELAGRACGRLYGAPAVPAAFAAYDALEAATLYAKANCYNIGFTNDWVYEHSTGRPGYAWQRLVGARALYRQAEEAFRRLLEASGEPGRAQAEYMRALCQISAKHIEAVYHLQNAKLPLYGYDAWPIESAGAVWPSAEVLGRLADSAERALALEREYMTVYSRFVTSCDEQGQLAMHQQGVMEPFTCFAETLRAQWRLALAQPQMD